MSEKIQFDEDTKILYSSKRLRPRKSKYVEWMINSGCAKNEKIATQILVGVAITFFVISIVIFTTVTKNRDEYSDLPSNINLDDF